MTKNQKRKLTKRNNAMHRAWANAVAAVESDLRHLREALSAPLALKDLRRYQRETEELKRIAKFLYAIRCQSKEISSELWAERHELFPERPPICGTASRHPHSCECAKTVHKDEKHPTA